MTNTCLGVTGYPGSGKGIVSDIASEMGFEIVVMGDKIREKTREDWGDRLNSAENNESNETPSEVYGKYATEMRNKHGRGIVSEWCIEEIKNSTGFVLIDGMRSPKELYSFREYVPVELLFIHAPASLRFGWIKERNRDNEESFTYESFAQRDKRENGWGLNELVQESDYTINNCVDKETFEENVKNFLTQFQEEYSSV